MSAVMTPPSTILRGRLRFNEPMAQHNSWRVGAAADRYYEPADIDDLGAFLASLPPQEPLLWIGLGSNLLVRDGGIRGTVINTTPGLGRYEWLAPGRLRAEAGVPCAKVARVAARAGFTGAEFLAGIPGTVGGALAMNAGACGGETWALVVAVETLDRTGQRHRRQRAEYRTGYREVHAPALSGVEGAAAEWFVAATLRLQPDTTGGGEDRIRALLARRAQTQPMGQPSCGSVFRNPPGDYAGRLIEASGLKGQRIGGASVSEKHANFIVNDGTATAADIEALIGSVRDTVRRDHGVALMAEVRIVGEGKKTA